VVAAIVAFMDLMTAMFSVAFLALFMGHMLVLSVVD
jgi:hypothetical protein